jgi:hypothetical protein
MFIADIHEVIMSIGDEFNCCGRVHIMILYEYRKEKVTNKTKINENMHHQQKHPHK